MICKNQKSVNYEIHDLQINLWIILEKLHKLLCVLIKLLKLINWLKLEAAGTPDF